MGRRDQDKKKGETGRDKKEMQDQEKWGEEMQEEKKWGDEMRDRKKMGR